ncbi:hypothetical protein UFOVP773_40 [uncultured Caudovirales phage]|uniref:Uncharacterized protein n=1 Tax=uncultured Caudovirales phage TaxID=2100421 RepID=A0A6J5NUG7_9CAUD|nr:hypothetical protein UFOVP773_40 [uncultured Caudovirales phage]
MESFNFGAFDTQLPGRIAAIPQEAEKQRTANMLQAMQVQSAMNQNELAQSQIRSARRAEEGQTLLGKAYGGLDFSGASTGGVPGQSPYASMKAQVIKSLTASGRADLIPGQLDKLTEMEHKANVNREIEGKLEKQTRDTIDAELISFAKNAPKVTDVPSLTNHLKAFFGHPLLGKIASKFKTYEQALADDIQQISTPEGLSRWQTENANLTGKELIDLFKKVTTTTTNLGNISRDTQRNALGQVIGTPVDTPIGVSPNTTATLKQQQDHFNSLSAFQKQQLADAGWSFDTERGIAVNAKRGISQPISTLMTPVSGGGAPAVGGATAPNIAPGGGVPGQRQAPAGQPAAGVLGPKPEKPTESYLKEQKGVINTNNAINNLKEGINNFTPADMVNPSRRAEITQLSKTASLIAKEMFNLGVLNGGDLKILEEVIPNPVAFNQGLVPIETIRKNLDKASNVVNQLNQTLSIVHKQPLMNLSSTKTTNNAASSAPPIQSFRRP